MKNKKVLSVFSLVMINIIAVDSIRALPIGAAYGLSLIFYYLLGAVCFMIPIALVAAELCGMYPEEGGIYVWVREAFGKRWGLFVAFVQWFYNVVWFPSILSFLAMILFSAIDPVLAHNKIALIILIVSLFSVATLFNVFGMQLSSWVSTVGACVGTLLPLLLFMGMCITWLVQGRPVAISMHAADIMPSFSHGNNLGILTGLVFGLIGLEMSAVHASDVKNPKRDYPRALAVSALVIILSMVFGSLAIALVVPVTQLNLASGVLDAFHFFLQAFGVGWLTPWIAGCILIGGISGVSAWLLGPGRCMMVASQDDTAPAIFARKNRFGSPVAVLFIQWLIFVFFCSVYVFFPGFNTAYWLLSTISSQLALLVYAVVFLAAISLHFKRYDVERSFVVPGGRIGMCLVAGLGFLTCILVFILGFIPPDVLHIEPVWLYETILVASVLILGFLPFYMYRRAHR